MTDHLTTEQLQKFLSGMSAEELLAVDAHLSGCEACRAQLNLQPRLAASLASLQKSLFTTPDRNHPTWEELTALSEGNLNAENRHVVESHLELCPVCQAEWKELHSFITEFSPLPAAEIVPSSSNSLRQSLTSWVYRLPELITVRFSGRAIFQLGAVGVVLALLIGGLWYWLKPSLPLEKAPVAQENSPTPVSTSPPEIIPNPSAVPVIAIKTGNGKIEIDPRGKISGIDFLSNGDEATVRAALQSGKVQLPSALNELKSSPDRLMGGGSEKSFRLLTPRGKIIAPARPIFRWQKLPGATTYVVTVADEASGFILTSKSLTTTRWSPPQNLPRGKTYIWQVVASTNESDVKSPASDEPSARFRILDQDGLETVNTAEKTYAGNQLMLGLIYARAGLLDEARRNFQLLLRENPESPIVKKLLQSIRARP